MLRMAGKYGRKTRANARTRPQSRSVAPESWLLFALMFARAVVPNSVLLDGLTVTDDIDPFPPHNLRFPVPAAQPAVPWFALSLALLDLVFVVGMCAAMQLSGSKSRSRSATYVAGAVPRQNAGLSLEVRPRSKIRMM